MMFVHKQLEHENKFQGLSQLIIRHYYIRIWWFVTWILCTFWFFYSPFFCSFLRWYSIIIKHTYLLHAWQKLKIASEAHTNARQMMVIWGEKRKQMKSVDSALRLQVKRLIYCNFISLLFDAIFCSFAASVLHTRLYTLGSSAGSRGEANERIKSTS